MMSSSVRFDSVYGIAEGCSVYVVYENAKTYPRYIIKFRNIESSHNKESELDSEISIMLQESTN